MRLLAVGYSLVYLLAVSSAAIVAFIISSSTRDQAESVCLPSFPLPVLKLLAFSSTVV